jgi:hypothetical protein
MEEITSFTLSLKEIDKSPGQDLWIFLLTNSDSNAGQCRSRACGSWCQCFDKSKNLEI